MGVEKGVQNIWVTINDPLTLECPAEGIPPPSITWRRQGQFIHEFGSPGLRIQDDGRKLVIVSAQLLDLGDYTCYVENVAGNSTLEYFVNVYGKALYFLVIFYSSALLVQNFFKLVYLIH